jgi:hypothetical protein
MDLSPGIIMEFCGGLGNKMFQIAAGYAASKKYDCPLYVHKKLDTNHHQQPVNYYDTIFRYMGIHLTGEEYEKLKLDSFPRDKNYIHNHIYQFMVSTEAYTLENLKIPVIFNQYFQYYPPIESRERELQEIFLKGLGPMRQHIRGEYSEVNWNRSAFVHVRRGDYLKYPDRHPLVSMKYYEARIANLKDVDTIFIFSDDASWIKEQPLFQNKKMKIIDSEDEIYCLAFMSMCHRAAICANSSFSWWGAFLGAHRFRNPVYIPETWILQCEVAGLFPKSWIKTALSTGNP